MNDKITPLLTLQEAGNILNVHPVTLTRWAKEGKITLINLPGGHTLRMTQDELTRIMAKIVGQASKPRRNDGSP